MENKEIRISGDKPKDITIFSSCDSAYFNKYARGFSNSIAKLKSKNLHIHFINPSKKDTDIVSEIYGRKKANQVVTAGLISSLFMLFVITIADMSIATSWSPVDGVTFSKVFGLSGAAVFASMIAYLIAQYLDVKAFHFWKKLTHGKHLWLRNNASTIFSQFVDTFSVLFLLCFLDVISWDRFSILLLNGFLFKVFFAAFDTPIIYGLTYFIRKKFGLKFGEEIS